MNVRCNGFVIFFFIVFQFFLFFVFFLNLLLKLNDKRTICVFVLQIVFLCVCVCVCVCDLFFLCVDCVVGWCVFRDWVVWNLGWKSYYVKEPFFSVFFFYYLFFFCLFFDNLLLCKCRLRNLTQCCYDRTNLNSFVTLEWCFFAFVVSYKNICIYSFQSW